MTAHPHRATVYDCTCERCGHEWVALKLPVSCAKCKSRSWNIPEGSVPLGRRPSKKVLKMKERA